MSDNKDSNKKKDEQDPFDFFKLSTEPSDDKKNNDDKRKKLRKWLVLLLVLGVLVVLTNLSGIFKENTTIPLSTFIENIKNGKYG